MNDHPHKPGIFSRGIFSPFRIFFKVFFGTLGILFGIVMFFSLISLMGSASKEEVDTNYKIDILPNADGVRKIQSKKTPVILQVNIDGIIGTNLLNMQKINDLFVESREGALKDNRVVAMLVAINSPGGTVTDSDGIYRAIMAYKQQYKVPVYAYIDGICASGGMYIASACDKVYASDVSIIGSVGVISPSFLNFSDLMKTVGISSLTLSEGKGKDAMNPLRPWKEGEDAGFRSLIKYYYDDFINIVTKARPNLSKEALINTYGAGIFPATLAKEYGYIDEAGVSRSDTLKKLLTEVHITDDYYQVVQLTEGSWLSRLFTADSSVFQKEIVHKLDLPQEYDSNLNGKFLYLYSPTRAE